MRKSKEVEKWGRISREGLDAHGGIKIEWKKYTKQMQGGQSLKVKPKLDRANKGLFEVIP